MPTLSRSLRVRFALWLLCSESASGRRLTPDAECACSDVQICAQNPLVIAQRAVTRLQSTCTSRAERCRFFFALLFKHLASFSAATLQIFEVERAPLSSQGRRRRIRCMVLFGIRHFGYSAKRIRRRITVHGSSGLPCMQAIALCQTSSVPAGLLRVASRVDAIGIAHFIQSFFYVRAIIFAILYATY